MVLQKIPLCSSLCSLYTHQGNLNFQQRIKALNQSGEMLEAHGVSDDISSSRKEGQRQLAHTEKTLIAQPKLSEIKAAFQCFLLCSNYTSSNCKDLPLIYFLSACRLNLLGTKRKVVKLSYANILFRKETKRSATAATL